MGKSSSFSLHIVLLLLSLVFKKLILCGILNSAEQFMQDFFVLLFAFLYCHVHELIEDLVLAFHFCEVKSSLVVWYKEFSCFSPAEIKPNRGLVSRPGAASMGNLFSNPHRGGHRKAAGGLRHASTTWCSSMLVTAEN